MPDDNVRKPDIVFGDEEPKKEDVKELADDVSDEAFVPAAKKKSNFRLSLKT